MTKLYEWKETMFSVLILGENVSLIGLLNPLMVIFSIWYEFIHFPPLKPCDI